MLQQVLENIHNRFIVKPYSGEYSIASSGAVSPVDFLIEGQRFCIFGSVLNYGLYTYHSAGCKNDDDTAGAGFKVEDFDGTICALAVPPSVIALAAEIGAWVAKYGDAVDSPFQSESFGGYSYSKGGRGSGTLAQNLLGWQAVFADRLKTWRKLC